MGQSENSKPQKAPQSPYQNVKLECPICSSEKTYRRLRSHLYIEQDREVDMHPLLITWSNKEFYDIHPPLYYMWHCPYCHFTAGHKHFEDPSDEYNMGSSSFRRAYNRAKEKSNFKEVSKILCDSINHLRSNYFQAVKLHLLAIYQLKCIDDIASKDAVNIARYNLLLAWLYREISLDSQEKKELTPTFENLFKVLGKYWEDVPGDETTALLQAIKYYEITLSKSYSVQTALDENKLFSLITRIYMKMDNMEKAKEYIQKSLERASKFEKIKSQLFTAHKKGEKKLSEEKISMISAESKKLKTLNSEMRNIYDNIMLKKEAVIIEEAKVLLSKHKGKTPEVLRKILLENKIDKKIILKLLPIQKKKKKFLGLFQ